METFLHNNGNRNIPLMKINTPVPFLLAFTHLNYRDMPEENLIRVEAVRKIHELIETNNPNGFPAVLMGDFNCGPGSDPANALEKKGWKMKKPVLTFPSKKPVISIGHIFVRDNRVEVTERIPVDEKTASDHIPVIDRLKIYGADFRNRRKSSGRGKPQSSQTDAALTRRRKRNIN